MTEPTNYPKFVASRTLKKASWNTTLIEGDIAERVANLKPMPGKGIIKYGTGALDQTLIERRRTQSEWDRNAVE